jgi:A/G-specific adenine glycosylase
MKRLPASLLLRWFKKNHRNLPWRRKYRPYEVLVSEFMLQQTRVEQALPYYHRWMKKFPRLQKLANAREEDVLKAWEGLGYYSRARNLHKTAKEIVRHYNGHIPANFDTLIRLPGIGPYIAGAVSSIAFNREEIVLDGNVARVLARWLGTTNEVTRPKTRTKFITFLHASLPPGHARDFNQALMELGALVCTPTKPACCDCPLSVSCAARQKGWQERLPVKTKTQKKPIKFFAAILVRQRGKIWLEKRLEKLLQGTYALPLVEMNGPNIRPGEIRAKIQEKYKQTITNVEKIGQTTHDYSHFRQTIGLFRATLHHPSKTMIRWYSTRQITALPLSRVNRKLLELEKKAKVRHHAKE